MLAVRAQTKFGKLYDCQVDLYADECPHCGHDTTSNPFCAAAIETEHGLELDLIFQCQNNACQHLFIANYETIPGRASERHFRLREIGPPIFRAPQVRASVRKTSPGFAAIYGQSAVAEGLKLKQVAGAGYRKALEFLVKDYCKILEPSKADSIEKTALGACINNFVTDENIKTTASRAVWLGNDETHYVRQYDDFDIEHLKELIDLTVNWIDTDVRTREFQQRLQKRETD